jgi:hypothetical protein
MLQSVNRFSADPALHLGDELVACSSTRMASVAAATMPMIILPHIAESNHGANPAARVGAIFINDDRAMPPGDSEMTADAFCISTEHVQHLAHKTNPATPLSQQTALEFT